MIMENNIKSDSWDGDARDLLIGQLVKEETKNTKKERSQDLLETGRLADCEFLVGHGNERQTFKGHKILLTIASPVLDVMLFGPMKEKGIVTITDISPNTFRIMLQYIYTEEVKFTSTDEAMDLYSAGDKYLMTEVKDYCENYICKNVSLVKVWALLQFSLVYGIEPLKKSATQMLIENTKRALQLEDFRHIDASALNVLLDQDVLAIDSELDIYNAAIMWARKECQRRSIFPVKDNLRSILEDGLKKIRFRTMTPGEFIHGPVQSGILTTDEVNSILIGMHCPDKATDVPTISKEVKSRGFNKLLPLQSGVYATAGHQPW